MIILAIDPDLRKSGVASYDTFAKGLMSVESLPLWEVFEFAERVKKHRPDDHIVLIERSSSKKTWHPGGDGASQNVGKNKAIAELLIDFCKAKGVNFHCIEPDGYSSYYTAKIGGKAVFLKEQFQTDHEWYTPTNKDSRAAVGMIYRNKYLINNLKQPK